MKRLIFASAVLSLTLLGFDDKVVTAADEKMMQQGPYQVVEGIVSSIGARMLIIDGQQYPVSMFVRVFMGSEKGQEIPMHTVVGIGKIDKARLLLLGGKVEKIIVLKNL